MYQRGNIVSVPFPFTDLTETKLRPALVISNDIVNSTGDLILVMITSKRKNDIFNIEILASDLAHPLPLKSFVRCHKLVTISSHLVERKVNEVSDSFLTTIQNKIDELIGNENDASMEIV